MLDSSVKVTDNRTTTISNNSYAAKMVTMLNYIVAELRVIDDA